MAYKAASILFFLLLPFLSTIKPSSAAGVNISAVLEKYPDYQYTVSLLQQANLTDPIAQQDKLTILAFKEAVIDQFPKNNLDGNGTIRALQTLVLLDYIDDAKMQSATDKPVSFNSLFQTIGKAPNNMGVVNMQKGSDGKVVFGSAVSGASMNTHVVKTVLTQPPNLSVLEIDNIIVPPGLMKLPLPDGTPAFSPPPRKPVWEDDTDIGSSGSASAPSTSGTTSAPSTSGSVSAPSTGGSTSTPSTSGSASAPTTSGSSSATVAPVAGVVHDTVAPQASTSTPKAGGASAPKGSETSTASSSTTSSAPSTSAGSPDSGAAGGPTSTTIMADGPASADGPGPSAASGVGRVMVSAGVGIGMVGVVLMSV